MSTTPNDKDREEHLMFTTNDLKKAGDHYWGYDYFPSHEELQRLADNLNGILREKINPST